MRWKLLTVLAVCLMIAPVAALAQTATPTPTGTSAPTWTPEVNVYWTLPAGTDAAGTPVPAHDVLFSYSANAGDVTIAVFALAVIISLWVMFLIAVQLNRRGNT